MQNWNPSFVLIIFGLAAIMACGNSTPEADSEQAIQLLPSPAGPESGQPNLFVDENGTVYLSWIEGVDEAQVALKFSVLQGEKWSPPREIARGGDWFVNWADFPALVALRDGTLAAHWLAKSSAGTYSYDVNLAFSHDQGKSWSMPVVPHKDGTPTEHGFVSLLPWRENQLLATWLDGRRTTTADGGAMTVHTAILSNNGEVLRDWELDERVCDCCQTAAAAIPEGAIVAYRDRSANEIRDMSYQIFAGGAWSGPQTVHTDGWEIPGCPVNGPALAADGQSVLMAWYTAPEGSSRVNVAFSRDAGRSFAAPVRADDGKPLGRVSAIFLADGSAVVCWLEQTQDAADIRIRRVRPDGTIWPSQTVMRTSASRASGFPRMRRSGDTLIFAWTEVGEPPKVQTARMTLTGL